MLPDSSSLSRRRPGLLALSAGIAVAGLALTACDRPGRMAPAAAAAASRAADEDGTAKYNAYVVAHDTLASGGGLGSTRSSYESAMTDVRRHTRPSFSTSGFDHAMDELKAARARIAPGFEELDAAADRLLATLEPLQRAMKPLAVYFDARTYVEDKGAFAIGQDATTVAAFDAAGAAQRTFDEALKRAGDARTARRLQTLEASGDRLGYDLLKSMTQARTLMDAIETAAKGGAAATAAPAAVKGAKPTRAAPGTAAPRLDTTAADAALAELERTLVEARREVDQRQAAQGPDSSGSPLAEQARAVAQLTSFGGAYRDWRADTGHEHGRMVVYAYNSAVDAFNRIPTRVYKRVSN